MFNISGVGLPICKIISDDKLNNKIVSLSEEPDEYISNFDEITLKNGRFQVLPDKTKPRKVCMCIVGANGSGKSYYIADYIKNYHKMYPSHPVFLISEKTEDDNLNFKWIKRIIVNNDLIEDGISLDELKEVAPCLVIADDIDSISPKKLKDSVYTTIDKLLKVGRSYSIDCIVTIHNYDGKSTRHFLNECNSLVFFPKNYNRSTEYLLKNYIGLDKQTIKKVRKCEGRAVTYLKTYPNIIVSEKQIFKINQD